MRFLSRAILVLGVIASSHAYSSDVFKALRGDWRGHLEDCIKMTGPAYEQFATDFTMTQKSQGGGLQGRLDLGAHGWAFFSQIDPMPDATYKLTLFRQKDDGTREEYRLEAKDQEEGLHFITPVTRPDVQITIDFSISGLPDGQISLVIKQSQPMKMQDMICSGTIERASENAR
jgi:hypothetical protein